MVTAEPDGNEHDAKQWLGIRTQPSTYCPKCGELAENCKCEKDK